MALQQDTCLAIPIPIGDVFITEHNLDCIELRRSCAFCENNSGVREQFNALTAFVDASNVYGETDQLAMDLRANSPLEGDLATSEHNLLPTTPQGNPWEGPPDDFSFEAGDRRANENPGLTTLHTIFVREHNRITAQIRQLQPSMTENMVYENARFETGIPTTVQ